MMKIKNVMSNDLRNVVGKAFIRVAKNHGYYGVFVKRFNKVKGYKSNQEENPFGNFDDLNTLMIGIDKLVDSQPKHNMKVIKASKQREYDKITMIINHMLHYFLEMGGVDGRRLGMIGQEIFDLTCYSLYGDDYVEEMEKINNGAPRPKNDMEAMMIAEYMGYIEKGYNISWDEFYAKKIKQLKKDGKLKPSNGCWMPPYDDDNNGNVEYCLYGDENDEDTNNDFDEENNSESESDDMDWDLIFGN